MLFLNNLFGKLKLFFLAFAIVNIFFYIYINDVSFNNLSYHHEKNTISNFKEELIKGDIIRGEFKAKENYLGIISIRFNEQKQNDDEIMFRFKQKGGSSWITSTRYHTIQFVKLSPFPFGIIPIANSKEKIYQFEIESLRGQHKEGTGLKNQEPILITSYQIPKEVIFQSPISLLSFLFKKVLTNLQNSDFVYTSIISFLPLIFLTISLLFPINKQRLIYPLFLFVLALVVLVNICFINTSYLITNVIVATINIVLFLKTQINYKFINIVCLFGILCALLLHWLRLTNLEYRVNLWTVTCIIDTLVYQLLNHIQISKKIVKS